jgi:predicted ester cyclase
MSLMTAGIPTDVFAVAEPVSREELNRLVGVQRAAFLAEGVPSADVRKSRIDRLMLATLENADEQFGRSFSDLDRDVIETIATPTKLITIMNLSGTHTGDFMEHAATGKRFTVRNVQVMGFREGKAFDRWGSTDELGILQQLGLA